MEGHGGLHLTETARPVLRGEQTLQLRRDSKPSRKSAPKPQPGQPVAFTDPAEQALWDALRQCRLQLAREQGVPPYVIFHDATLREMLEQQPASLDDLGRISGVGQRKLEHYGEIFLEVLRRHSGKAATIS